ncbi:hypothetical protein Sru01_58710 [Sphaerisporangium rufum]|uniref:Helix-turn-helix domain-containing protein n=2 Tax=Sphaerisporangium rufum TaxID=1381558 RepID=A0A919R777_9ACTN|nr:hypothetical protein Sru01_58710 [Sphaerisporangium rufum]
MPRTSVLARVTQVAAEEGDRALLAHVSESSVASSELVLRVADGEDVVLPEALLRLVFAAAHDLAKGEAILAIPVETWLTPNETARLLGLSRPFVARLLDEGEIPARRLPDSNHRQVRLSDVLEFQARRERRAEGNRRIMELAEEANLPY